MRQLEGLFHDNLKEAVKKLQSEGVKIYMERRPAKGISFVKGSADCFIVYNGKHFEIEEKAPDGSRTVMQEKWEAKCRRLGMSYILAADVDEVLAKIKE